MHHLAIPNRVVDHGRRQPFVLALRMQLHRSAFAVFATIVWTAHYDTEQRVQRSRASEQRAIRYPILNVLRLQARPEKPTSQVQTPLAKSQLPRFEHTEGWCARSVPTARSFHAGPVGHVPVSMHHMPLAQRSTPAPLHQFHVRLEQSPPVKPL